MPQVRVVEFEPRFADNFAELNYQWITEYFRIEEEDRRALDQPLEYAILPGGNILIISSSLFFGALSIRPTLPFAAIAP